MRLNGREERARGQESKRVDQREGNDYRTKRNDNLLKKEEKKKKKKESNNSSCKLTTCGITCCVTDAMGNLSSASRMRDGRRCSGRDALIIVLDNPTYASSIAKRVLAL